MVTVGLGLGCSGRAGLAAARAHAVAALGTCERGKVGKGRFCGPVVTLTKQAAVGKLLLKSLCELTHLDHPGLAALSELRLLLRTNA